MSTMERRRTTWIRKLGWAGFFFFLIKGLIWLGLFFGLGKVLGVYTIWN